MKRIVIKVGTNVLTRHDGMLDKLIFRQVVVQLVKLIQAGWHPVLVSSGAVGAGRSIIGESGITSEAIRRQVLSAVGQTSLMKRYFELFIEYDIVCAQVLTTKEDFAEGEHYQNMINCFEGLIGQGIVPIVNENDVVSLTELMFTDNDELAGLTASMIGADKLIILSNVDGVYDDAGQVIGLVPFGDNAHRKHISVEKSGMGRGGMHSKVDIATRAAEGGIETFIANGKQDNIVLDILSGKGVGTRFATKEGIK
ncbi:MAG: glutamate 5-kinase [Marinoscillum sp.]|uniref:glutamate 5-kinase n=1 Tax=Marinoscillum sp. TaxID=2024838 RepID=UPI0032FD9644